MFFFGAPSPSILTATADERHEAIEKLIEPATLRRGYYLLLTLAVAIATAGLLAGNAAVIIGGMILAPLLLPILAIALSVVTRSAKGLLHSLMVLLLSVLITLVLSYGIAWLFSYTTDRVTWIPEIISPDLYLFIAFCSGIAAAFAWVKEDFAPGIAGIAIAVSLLPPLCAVGIGGALADLALASNSLLLFLLNLIGILGGAMIVFILLGFAGTGALQEKMIEKTEK